MIQRHKISIFFLVVSVLFFSSCGALVKGKAKKFASVKEGAIPQDFDGNDGGVIFLTYERSYNKYLKKNVRKAFSGRHVFLPVSSADSLRDKTNLDYRYLFGYDNQYGQRYSNNTAIYGPGGGLNTYRVRRFYLRDLATDSIYTLKMTSGLWSKLQRYYLRQLEAQRFGNK